MFGIWYICAVYGQFVLVTNSMSAVCLNLPFFRIHTDTVPDRCMSSLNFCSEHIYFLKTILL